ncbi:MAG: hypothetical protein AB9903_17300 [Vulcanimicrobiota bacterium]
MKIHFFEISRALWESAGRTAPGVFWRVFLGGTCGFIISLVVFFLWYRFVFKKRWLSIHQRVDRVMAWLIIPFTALSILIFTVLSGLTIGTASAISYVITNEHLGEQASKLALKGITTAVIMVQKTSHGKPMSSNERLAYANRLISGEESIPIESLKTITPHHLAELSTIRVQSYIPGSESRTVHNAAVRITECSISWMIYAAADDRTDFLYKTVVAMAEHDKKTDGDGRVTVEEIATVISRVHMEKAVVKVILEAGLLKAGFFLISLFTVLVIPPFCALLLRSLIKYFTKRKMKSDGKVHEATVESDIIEREDSAKGQNIDTASSS